jgi:hypothetical protein
LDAAPDEVEPPEAESREAAARIARVEVEVRAALEEAQQALSEVAEVRRLLDVDAATDEAAANTLVLEDREREQGSRFKQESEFSVAASPFRSLAEEALPQKSIPRAGCTDCSSWNTRCSSWNPLNKMWDSGQVRSREQDSPFSIAAHSFHVITEKAQDVKRGALGVLREVRRIDAEASLELENILDKILGGESREQRSI